MRTSSRNDTHGAATTGGSNALPTDGASPYATGGGGISFERKVAVKYLALMLTGDGAAELGDGRVVVHVAFQQAPTHPLDDLVVSASHPDELEPSLNLALAIRRSPNLVQSVAQESIRVFATRRACLYNRTRELAYLAPVIFSILVVRVGVPDACGGQFKRLSGKVWNREIRRLARGRP